MEKSHIFSKTENYQTFADRARRELQEHDEWKEQYSSYVQNMIRNQGKYEEDRKRIRRFGPLFYYLTIGEINRKSERARVRSLDIRYMGQSVASVVFKRDNIFLKCDSEQANHNCEWFRLPENDIFEVPWTSGKAAKFRRYFASSTSGCRPRQPEHRVEDALYTELEKNSSGDKSLLNIQPVAFNGNKGIRVHMKTAFKASEAKQGKLKVSAQGGEIDLFCRRKIGNRSRLTVIELKDENKPEETFHKAIYQAIAYAVFILELIRGSDGESWMKLWGMENQPWKDGVVINAVAAMPEGDKDDLSFAGQRLKFGKDIIELHYIALSKDVNNQSAKIVATSLKKQKEERI